MKPVMKKGPTDLERDLSIELQNQKDKTGTLPEFTWFHTGTYEPSEPVNGIREIFFVIPSNLTGLKFDLDQEQERNGTLSFDWEELEMFLTDQESIRGFAEMIINGIKDGELTFFKEKGEFDVISFKIKSKSNYVSNDSKH